MVLIKDSAMGVRVREQVRTRAHVSVHFFSPLEKQGWLPQPGWREGEDPGDPRRGCQTLHILRASSQIYFSKRFCWRSAVMLSNKNQEPKASLKAAGSWNSSS